LFVNKKEDWLSNRYITIETKEAASIEYDGFLFPHNNTRVKADVRSTKAFTSVRMFSLFQ